MASDVPIIQIEIDDAQYRAFEERVKQFRAEESEAPGAWEGTAEQIEIIKRRFEEMSRAAGSGASAARDTEASAKSTIGTFSDGAAVAWDLMRPLVRGTAHTIAGAARDLAKWERAAAVVGGLLGAGSLIGLDRLAEKASARRRQATGLGVSTGQLAAFQTDFGRLGDTDSLLRGFNTAATDQLARQPLQSLGIDARGKNATQLFAEALPRVKELVDRIDPKMMGPTLIDSYHLDRLGFSEETLRLIRRMKRSEIQDMLSSARHDAPGFDIPDDIGRKWTDLVNQLTVAGNRIETALADSLVNIAPGVTHVSESLVRLTNALLSQPQFTQWLGETADGIEKLAGWIGSSEAQKSLRHAVDQFKMSRDDVRRLEDWLGSHAGTLRALGGAAAGAAVGGMVGGPVGAAVGAAVGGAGAYVSHDDAPGEIERRRQESLRHSDAAGQRQRAAGAAAERPTLAERNAERSGLGLKPYASQDEYDKAEPVVGTPTGSNKLLPPHSANNDRSNSGVEPPDYLNDRSRRELSGVDAPLAESFIEAAKRSGYQFQVSEGTRSQAEANANAAAGVGVSNSQHMYGAAADIVLYDKNGNRVGREGYEKFAQSFDQINQERGNAKFRWLGHSTGRWGNDIVHFDEGIGEGQRKLAAGAIHPYGHAGPPTKEDVAAANTDAYKSGANPFLHKPSAVLPPASPTATDDLDPDYHYSRGGKGVRYRDNKVDADIYTAEVGPLKGQRVFFDDATHKARPLSDIMHNHPNNRPPPAPVVHVTDNTGGASQVSVHQ